MKRVEGHSNLAKTDTGAVLITDPKLYERAKRNKMERERLNNLEDKMERIENLLLQLVNEK